MSDEELKEEQEPQEGAEDLLDQENAELNTECLVRKSGAKRKMMMR